MNKKILINLGFVILFQFSLTGTLQAAIFKCVSDEGEVFYLDKPCPVNHDEESMKHVKDPKNSAKKVIPTTPKKPIEKSAKVNENIQVKRWPVKGESGNSKHTTSSSVSKKAESVSNNAKDLNTVAGKTTANSSKPEDFSESSLPVDFNTNNIEEMSGEIVERLSHLKAF